MMRRIFGPNQHGSISAHLQRCCPSWILSNTAGRRNCGNNNTTTKGPSSELSSSSSSCDADTADSRTRSRDTFTLPFRMEELMQGQRRALSKAITLVESDNPHHAARVGDVLRRVAALSAKSQSSSPSIGTFGHAATTAQQMKKSVPRIAISGSPGAGKSCFIEAFGLFLIETFGFHVGVIAVDPSSSISSGSILGDKTRMEKLSMHPNAYIRPSPSRGHLGGATARCWEVMQMMECAKFDVIIVETVGVGQSETEVKHMTDLMLLLVPPASGDELQGIKKGIVEVADMVIVTKNDGERVLLAQQTKAAYTNAVQFRSDCHVQKPVIAVSAREKQHLDKVWEALSAIWARRVASGELQATRRMQRVKHFEAYFMDELKRRALELLKNNGEDFYASLRDDVAQSRRAPREAGECALERIFRDR